MPMYTGSPYLTWVRRHYEKSPYDLASSGIPTVDLPPNSSAHHLPVDQLPSSLRQAIGGYHGLSPSEVLPALGTSHAIWLAYASVLSPGDGILVENPTYDPLVETARGFGATVRRFARRPEDRYAIDVDAVLSQVTSDTRLVVLSNLHNPTGVRTPDSVLRALGAELRTRGAYLLVDEVYAPFDALVGADGIFHGSARKLGPNVLAIGSLTKCFGLGLRRVGWVLAPEDLVASGEHALTLNVGTLPEAYARLALDSFQALPSLVSRTQQHLFGAASAKHPEPSKRELVNSWMEARPRFQWSCPDEGLFGFARCPWLPTTTPRVEEGIRTLGLIVGAGEFFGDCQGFRLAWSAPEDTLRQGLVFLDNLFSAPG